MSRVAHSFRIVLFVILSSLILSGCVGIYNNEGNFLNLPETGSEEINALKELGPPAFSTEVEDQKIYIYKARNVKYIICVGLYEGYDVVITCRDGMVVDSKKIARPKTFTFLTPVPWAVTD